MEDGRAREGRHLAATVIHVLVGSVLRIYGVLYNTAHAGLYCTILYITVQYCTVLYSTNTSAAVVYSRNKM